MSQNTGLPEPGKQQAVVIGQRLRTEPAQKPRSKSAAKAPAPTHGGEGNPGRTRLSRPSCLVSAQSVPPAPAQSVAPWRKVEAEPSASGSAAEEQADGIAKQIGKASAEAVADAKPELQTKAEVQTLQQKLAEADTQRQSLERQVALEKAAQATLQREKQLLERDLITQKLQVQQLHSQLEPLLQLQDELEFVYLHPGNRLFTVPSDIDARTAYRLGWEAAIEVARQVAQEEADRVAALCRQAEVAEGRSLEEPQPTGWTHRGATGHLHPNALAVPSSQPAAWKAPQALDVSSPSDDGLDPRHDGATAAIPRAKRQKKTLGDWITDQSEFEGLQPLPEGWIRIRSKANDQSLLYFNTLNGSYQLTPPEVKESGLKPSSSESLQESVPKPVSAVAKPSAKPASKQHAPPAMLGTKQETAPLDEEVTLSASADDISAAAELQGTADDLPPQLPPGWTLCYSRTSGKPYYYHAGQKKSQYAWPTG